MADDRDLELRATPGGFEIRPRPYAPVEGGQPWDHVDRIAQLKRDRRHAEAERILLAICDELERDASTRSDDWATPPWYFRQLAIIYRKDRRYADEIAILERYRRVQRKPGVLRDSFNARIEKARALLAKASGKPVTSLRAQRLHALQCHARALDEALWRLAHTRYWTELQQQPRWYSRRYLERLIASVITADDDIAPDEVLLAREYHDDARDVSEEYDWIRETAAQFPDFPWIVPPFFAAAVVADFHEGSDYAGEIVRTVESVCAIVMMSDGVIEPAEVAHAETVLATLRDAEARIRRGPRVRSVRPKPLP